MTMRSGPKRLDREVVRADVLTACRRLMANGENPTIIRLVDMLPYGDVMIRQTRACLVADGLVQLPEGCSNRKTAPPDDGVTEIPDDPDRNDVEARIAAARARKKTLGRPESFVMRARCVLPGNNPRSRQSTIA